MEASNTTNYSDKLKEILNETSKYKYKCNDDLVVDREKALSIVQKHLNRSNDIERHIFNTIRKILNEVDSYFKGEVLFYSFVHDMCYSFINATLKEYDCANYIYTHFTERSRTFFESDNIVLNDDHFNKTMKYADKFFVKENITLNLDDNQLNLHKKIYKKAFISSFKKGINVRSFFIKFRFNIFKTYETELLSKE
jgi:RNAse (barnase) inhibitor barstar